MQTAGEIRLRVLNPAETIDQTLLRWCSSAPEEMPRVNTPPNTETHGGHGTRTAMKVTRRACEREHDFDQNARKHRTVKVKEVCAFC